MEIAVLALGCFWGPEQLSKIDGRIKTRFTVEAIVQLQIIKKFVLENKSC